MTVQSDERVRLAVGAFAAELAPGLGGKIASIRMQGRELLQAPLLPYAERTRTMAFEASDASGWDECFPSVAACTVTTEAGALAIPDHGDLWRTAWQVTRADARSCSMRGQCFSLPLTLERTVALMETGEGWRLELAYRVSNEAKLWGGLGTPWLWAAHPLFAVEAGDRIVLPASIDTLRLEGSGGGRLGAADARVRWPVAELESGGHAELSVAQSADAGLGDKLFAGPLQAHENWAALERARAGVRIRVGFDAAATPYLGLWLCYGGWPERAGAKQMCVALEPATAPVDSLAREGPWTHHLAPGEAFCWTMSVDFERLR